MLSKFKVMSLGGGNFATHFQQYRAQSCAPAQIQPSLTEVYEAEIRRLREENHNLRIQHNSIITQLHEVLAQLHQSNAERTLLKQRIAETENIFYNTKKDFWQLTPAARNNKKRRVRQLVAQSVKGLEEIEPIEVRNNFTFSYKQDLRQSLLRSLSLQSQVIVTEDKNYIYTEEPGSKE